MIVLAIWLSGFSVSAFWILMFNIRHMHPDYRLRDQIGFFIVDAVILGAFWPWRLVLGCWYMVVNFFHGNP